MKSTPLVMLLLVVGIGGVVESRSESAVHWAYRPLGKVRVPHVRDEPPVQTPIDRFIMSRLENAGLGLSSPADPRTLIRRLHLDLIGLPPTPEQVAAFERAFSRNPGSAFRALTERLLASPQFGERWGRHWLDAAGYVDVIGTDNDAGAVMLAEGKWRYRDYVIDSFNRDKPFNQFLTEQLAGDELVDWRAATGFTALISEHLIATTFLRAAADDTDAPELNTPDIRHRVLQQTTEIIGANLLAMTLQCAKCHDHKYDPIRQRDFYSLAAVFSPAFNPKDWLVPAQRRLADIALPIRAEIDAFNAPIDKRIERIEKRRKEAAKDKKTKIAARLAEKAAELRAQRKSYEYYQSIYDTTTAPETHVLKRGDFRTPGDRAEPGLPGIIASGRAGGFAAEDVAGESTGRRLAFARELTRNGSPAAALAARVQVNRVWQHLFGTGLVESSDNFGPSGQRPSHPELLEWLTAQFVAEGGSFKSLIRRIVNSAVYRQASDPAPAARMTNADPQNQFLWRMPLKRLESEIVRDSLLAVAGNLDSAMGGEPVWTKHLPDGRLEFDTERLTPTQNPSRRSIYVLARRNYHLTILNLFDQPSIALTCTRRLQAATVTQSLALLNDEFVLEQAHRLARRVGIESKSGNAGDWTICAFQIVLGRSPDASESQWANELIRRHIARYLKTDIPWTEAAEKALEHLCQMLLNTSEFLHVP